MDARINRDVFSPQSLGGLAGLSPPNDFTIDDLKAPLANRRFPKEGYADYCWAIAESFDRQSICEIDDNDFLLYITAIYLYCNAKEPFGMELSGFYIQRCIAGFWESSDRNGLTLTQTFLKSLNLEINICVKYFALLGLLFIGRALNVDDDCASLYEQLECIRNAEDDFEEFDDLADDSDCQVEWQELDRKLPVLEWSANMDFKRMLFL